MKESVFSVVYRGVCWALVLAWLALIAKRVSFAALPFAAIPIVAAFGLGWHTGYRNIREDLGKKDD